jgi:hypothetical protein
MTFLIWCISMFADAIAALLFVTGMNEAKGAPQEAAVAAAAAAIAIIQYCFARGITEAGALLSRANK